MSSTVPLVLCAFPFTHTLPRHLSSTMWKCRDHSITGVLESKKTTRCAETLLKLWQQTSYTAAATVPRDAQPAPPAALVRLGCNFDTPQDSANGSIVRNGCMRHIVSGVEKQEAKPMWIHL